LHAHGEPVYTALPQYLDIAVSQMIRICFHGNFFNGETFARQRKYVRQFVDKNRGSTAAHINSAEFISLFVVEINFAPQRAKIFSSQPLFKTHPMKGTIRTKLLTKRNVDVEQARFLIRAEGKIGNDTFFKFQRPGKLPFDYLSNNLINHI